MVMRFLFVSLLLVRSDLLANEPQEPPIEIAKIREAFAQEGLTLSEKDHIFLLVSHEQLRQTLPVSNWTTKDSKGHCLAIDCLNWALLTGRIAFQESDKADTANDIMEKLKKIEQVHIYDGRPVIIKGFTDANEFLSEMESDWGSENNPLRRFLESSQKRFGESVVTFPEKVGLVPRRYDDAFRKNRVGIEKANQALKAIRQGKPLRLGSWPTTVVVLEDGTIDRRNPHIVTVIGYVESKSENSESTYRLITIDSNQPREFTLLELVFEEGDKAYVRPFPTIDKAGFERILDAEIFWLFEERADLWKELNQKERTPFKTRMYNFTTLEGRGIDSMNEAKAILKVLEHRDNCLESKK
jgi:hypothetical protein